MRRHIWGLALVAALLSSLFPAPTSAGTYSVKFCEGGTDPLFLNPGLQWHNATGRFVQNSASSCGGSGFLALSIDAAKTYPSFSTAGYSLFVPAGTVMPSFSGQFGSIHNTAAGNLIPL